jgi:hypothetical protein
MGSAPRAHQGEAPANAGADPSGIPGRPRFLTSRIVAASHALVQTRSSRGPEGGRSPSTRVALALTKGGLPVGIEMVVLPYHEPDLFKVGYAFEQATRYRLPPQSTPAL